jgi:hypothetical protein
MSGEGALAYGMIDRVLERRGDNPAAAAAGTAK